MEEILKGIIHLFFILTIPLLAVFTANKAVSVASIFKKWLPDQPAPQGLLKERVVFLISVFFLVLFILLYIYLNAKLRNIELMDSLKLFYGIGQEGM